METLAESIGGLGSSLFRWSSVAFLLINGTAVIAVLATRNSSLVNRWTSRLLAANLLLAATGLGVPAAAAAMKLVIKAVSANKSTEIRFNSK